MRRKKASKSAINLIETLQRCRMKKFVLLGILTLISANAFAECVGDEWLGPWSGPSPVPPTCPQEPITPSDPPDPKYGTGPLEICLNATLGCAPVIYKVARFDGAEFALAFATIDGYPLVGSAGPCLYYQDCRGMNGVAYSQLVAAGQNAMRAIRFESERSR